MIPDVTSVISLLIESITLCPSDPALIELMLFEIVPSIPLLNTPLLKPPEALIQLQVCPGTIPVSYTHLTLPTTD